MNMTSLQRFCKHIKSIASFDVETLNQAMARLESFGENSPAALPELMPQFHDGAGIVSGTRAHG